MENMNQALGACLTDRGVTTEAVGTWLKPSGQDRVIRARRFETEMEEVYRLGVQIPFDDGRLLTESYLFKAESQDDKDKKGFEAFAEHALPVIVAGFFGGETDETVTLETWETKHGPLQAWAGKMVFSAEGEQEPKVPQNLRATIKDLVHDREIDHRHHWLRVAVLQRDGEVMTEVLWDNEVWREAEAVIQHLGWEASEDFSSYRWFVAFEFDVANQEEVAEEPDPAIFAETFLSTLFHLPLEDQSDESSLLDLLDRMGYEAGYVRRALQLVPIALGRQLLADTEQAFSDDWIELNAEGQERDRGSLQDEPIYTQAMQFDQDAIGRAFGLYATSSVEVEALNKLAEVEDAEPWIAPPVLIYSDPPTPAGKAKGDALLEDHAKTMKAESAARVEKGRDGDEAKKSWWKFW